MWNQADGKVDGFVYSARTGGMLTGVGRALKTRNPAASIGAGRSD